MAKKQKKNSGKKKQAFTVTHGGVTFAISKSASQFAVRKRVGAVQGALEDAADDSETFSSLALNSDVSTQEVEVYSVDADCLDSAMEKLRTKGRDVDWCSHVYHAEGDSSGLMVPQDTIYIEFASGADRSSAIELFDDYGLELLRQDEDDPNRMILRVTSAATLNPIKIANLLAENADIEVAEPEFATRISFKAHRPTDSLFADQWHLENRGGDFLTAGADVSAPDTWDITRGSRSVVVAIADDGVDLTHDDFSSPGKIIGARDFGQNDNDPTPVRNGRGRHGDNHGTACAGVAVADENGRGVVGIAPNCALMPIRTSGLISSDSIEDLFDHMRLQGADVISCSWGVARKHFALTTRMKRAISKAATEGRGGKGCIVLFAAGNENSPVDGIDSEGDPVLAGFAKHPDVMAIAASNSRDLRSHYSNFGPEIWVAAPSSGRGGRGILTTDRSGDKGYEDGDFTIRDPFGGTSSSTPLVAGICGLMLSVNPNLTEPEVREILRDTSDKIDPANGAYGADGHSNLYGYGRVNAAKAVAEAQRRLAPVSATEKVFSSTPGHAIPDNNQVGISDTIVVSDTANLTSVAVSVNVTHPWRGDLEVALIAPSGDRVVLHNRTGQSADNLVMTYTAENLPALNRLVAGSAAGNWTLQVRDLASADTGTLNSWTLTLGLDAGDRTEWEVSPGTAIPDGGSITSSNDVDGSGVLANIAVELDITHTWRGDLTVEIEEPSGEKVALHARGGGSADHIQRTFRPADTPALNGLLDGSIEINGEWKLHVRDNAREDVGKLNRWKLTLLR